MNDNEIIEKAWDSFNYTILTIKEDFHNAVGKAIVLARASERDRLQEAIDDTLNKKAQWQTIGFEEGQSKGKREAFAEVLEWLKENSVFSDLIEEYKIKFRVKE